jgi:REP element-mobilizing transposase RayT
MPHRAFGIYVHITWHTRFRQRLIRRADVHAVRAAINQAADRWQVHVHEVAILSDHVHVIASFPRREAWCRSFDTRSPSLRGGSMW